MLRSPFGLVLVATLAFVAAPHAEAQSASEVAAARRLFRAGIADARAGRWDEALGQFERSYAIAPRPSTLLNLAGAQAQTGALVAAMESYRRFLDVADSGRARRHRAQAEQALEALEGRVAQVTVRVEGLADADVVRFGDQELSRAALGVELPVDPGDRALLVTRDGREVLREELSLAEGERREIAVEVQPDLTVQAGPTGGDGAPAGAFEADGPEGGGDDSGVVIGVVVAVAAAVVIAGVITTVVLVDQAGQPHQGTLGDGVIPFE